MCGIVGIAGFNDSQLIREMANTITSRGPDQSGFFSDKNIELGHLRLSIIDLVRGKQPIFNENKDICIIFNGEIYNFKSLKNDLLRKGHKFYTETDTEVIIHAYEEYEDFLSRLNGMFAFAIYDSKKKKILIARDKIGIKPLYYHFDGNNLIFGSEIKSIIPALKKITINKDIISTFLDWSYFPGENTPINGIKKVLPGHSVSYQHNKIKISKFWDIHFSEKDININILKKNFIKNFSDSVEDQLEADVPVGIFLSGGLDSSSIAAIAKKFNPFIKTFSVGFESPDVKNELVYAKKVSDHLGTDHREIIIKEQVPKYFKKIISSLDEPVANLTSIPLYLLSKYAKKEVKVILTGSGSDELFAGYRHHKLMNFFLNNQTLLNSVSPLTKLITSFSPNNRYLSFVKDYTSSKDIKSLFGLIRLNKTKRNYSYIDPLLKNSWSHLNKILSLDIKFLLPENYLLQEDRMTMANSLESRVPFLDDRMVHLSETTPCKLKLNGTIGKYILRKSMENFLPKEIIYRRKYGFTAPLSSWWKEYFQEELECNMGLIKKQKFLDYTQILKMSKLAKSGDKESINKLWSRLVFQIWLNNLSLDIPS